MAALWVGVGPSVAVMSRVSGSDMLWSWAGKNYYKGQGGWDGCTLGGVKRFCFAFSDSQQVSGYMHADDGEGIIG